MLLPQCVPPVFTSTKQPQLRKSLGRLWREEGQEPVLVQRRGLLQVWLNFSGPWPPQMMRRGIGNSTLLRTDYNPIL